MLMMCTGVLTGSDTCAIDATGCILFFNTALVMPRVKTGMLSSTLARSDTSSFSARLFTRLVFGFNLKWELRLKMAFNHSAIVSQGCILMWQRAPETICRHSDSYPECERARDVSPLGIVNIFTKPEQCSSLYEMQSPQGRPRTVDQWLARHTKDTAITLNNTLSQKKQLLAPTKI